MNPTPTPQTAEQFARKILNKIEKPDNREFSIIHSKAVGETALLLAQGKNIDKDTLVIAAWLHDIGYSIKDKDHAQHSLEILKNEGFEISETIKDCILNHGSSKNPQTQEGKIFQIADKVCILNKDILKVFLKHNKGKIKQEDFDFLKMMTTRAVELLKNYD